MLSDRVRAVRDMFGVDLIDYQREGSTGILFSSGCGIGLAIMDACPDLRYFVDIDSYRSKLIDWESLAIVLSVASPRIVVLAGWFSLDRPYVLESIEKGLVASVSRVFYRGGDRPLIDALEEIYEKCSICVD